ncbi:hypothetical protein BJV82DRAFT_667597 [Fennellomyces sp. T-0311]|nr:hypothetical protein BJV82DRAFT_667597 [Fennellomyces sp. T-0311]
MELCYGGATYDVICSHLLLCPNLRRLVLKPSSNQQLGDPGNTTFADYNPKLKSLGLNCADGLPDLSEAYLLRELLQTGTKAFSLRLTESTLCDLKIAPFLGDDVLPSLAKSDSIQQLTIAECNNVTSDGLTEFLKQLALRPSHRLETLELSSLSASLTVSAVRYIVKIKLLGALRVVNDKNFGVTAVNELVDQATCSNLQTIEIRGCFSAGIAKPTWSDAIHHLGEKGINLAIT